MLFQMGHPAHFHLFKNVIDGLRDHGHETHVTIKPKDVLADLLDSGGYDYHRLVDKERRDGRLGIAVSLLMREFALLRLAKKLKPNIMVGTSAEIAHVGRLTGIRSVVVNEDDHDVVPLFARAAYPFADVILAPACCRVGKWAKRTITYEGYHELAYLHPEHFTPNADVGKKLAKGRPYFVIRFARLTAHHDVGRRGLATEQALELVDLLSKHGHVYITSEKELDSRLESYRLRLPPEEMHSALYYAAMYIGDSQTMAAEAAVLGTPSLRFNDFVGQISYLEELEHRYGLTRGIPTDRPDTLLKQVTDWLATPDLKGEWQRRREKMLSEKVNVADFMVSLLSGLISK